MKKKFPSLHLNADDFIPATNDEKESLVEIGRAHV